VENLQVYYQLKFTQVWTLAVGRFPDDLGGRVPRIALSESRAAFSRVRG
jgi:hypothetical protein